MIPCCASFPMSLSPLLAKRLRDLIVPMERNAAAGVVDVLGSSLFPVIPLQTRMSRHEGSLSDLLNTTEAGSYAVADQSSFSRRRNCPCRLSELPAVVEMRQSGAHFVSYINNLHPDDFQEVYLCLEELITYVLPLFAELIPGLDVTSGTRHQLVIRAVSAFLEPGSRRDWLSSNLRHLEFVGFIEKLASCVITYEQCNLLQTATVSVSRTHHIAPTDLADPALPGRKRTVMIMLVAPSNSCNARTVIPQQIDWWQRALVKKVPFLGHLPSLVLESIWDFFELPTTPQKSMLTFNRNVKQWEDYLASSQMLP